MKRTNIMLALAAVALALMVSASDIYAQGGGGGGGGGGRRRGGGGGAGGGNGGGGGGNFDPAQRTAMMVDRWQQTLEFTDDTEWTAVRPLVQKIVDAQTAARQTTAFPARGGRGGNGGGAGGDQAGGAAAGGGGNGGGRGGAFGATTNPAVEALRTALDAKAPADDIKTKLAKVRDEKKSKDAAVVKAQEDLKKVLSARREALGVLYGLLN